MGSGQSTVSAGKLLARASKSPGSESLAAARSLPPREVRSRLAKLGVVPDQDDSPEELARALATAQDPDYWVANWELHPNSGRVKNWLWVHSRFRYAFARYGRPTSGQTYNIPPCFLLRHTPLELNCNYHYAAPHGASQRRQSS